MAPKLIPYYDDQKFDYQKYWQKREYENQAEKIALKKFLQLIKGGNLSSVKATGKIIDIGAGFGRLTPVYANLFASCLLIEPSQKLLQEGKNLCREYQNIDFKKSFVEKLPVEDEAFEVALMIRVAHHLGDLQAMIKEVKRILKPGGFFILEFANKIHFKRKIEAFLRFNLDFFTNHQPENLKTKKKNAPFYNYHPNQIKTLLLSNDFKIIRCLSVSNFRHSLFKKIFPLSLLLFWEDCFQKISSKLPFLTGYGPSVFVLAQKQK